MVFVSLAIPSYESIENAAEFYRELVLKVVVRICLDDFVADE